MSWWRRFRHGDADRAESQAAVVDANRSLLLARSRHAEVRRLSQSLEAQGQRNHFIERLNMHVARGANGH